VNYVTHLCFEGGGVRVQAHALRMRERLVKLLKAHVDLFLGEYTSFFQQERTLGELLVALCSL